MRDDTLEDLRIVHLSPGRVRLRSHRLRSMPALGTKIQERLAAIPGVERVELNALTGSVLLVYDRKRLASEGALARLGKVLDELFPTLDRASVFDWLKRTA